MERFLKRSRAIVLIVGVALLGAGCGREEAPQWNVVLVVIDTLRADHCSSYGYFRKTTPHLEALASRGTLYENAWSQAPWTSPSMVSLFTGRYVLSNYKTVPPDTRLLAERFQDQGYDTGALVANPILYKGTGFERGFRHFEVAPKTKSGIGMTSDVFAPKATELLTTTLKEPYFAWLHLFDPHHPYRPPLQQREAFQGIKSKATVEDYRRRQHSQAKKIDGQVMKDLERTIVLYDGEVAFADETLGRIMAALESHGLRDRTIIVVTSDHGEGLFSHSLVPDSKTKVKRNPYGDHGLYGYHGRQVYEEALHVPLVIAGPGFLSGERRSGLVEVVDSVPTLLSATGLPEDPGAAGVDLRGLGEKGKAATFAFSERNDAIRVSSGLKLIHPNRKVTEGERNVRLYELDDSSSKRKPQLFALDSDPLERKNLFSLESREFKELKKVLLQWQENYKHSLSDGDPDSEEMKEHLRALGYL